MRPPAYSLRSSAKPAGVLARPGPTRSAPGEQVPGQTDREPGPVPSDYKIPGVFVFKERHS
jgi:hypothetical protein